MLRFGSVTAARCTACALALCVPSAALAYGEADAQGLPTARERLLHVLSNQVRAAPAEWPHPAQPVLPLPDATPRPPLALHPELSAAAHFHVQDMSRNGCFSHESCDGTTFETRIRQFFSGGAAGENIAKGQRDEREVLTGWMDSAGHRSNLLQEGFDHLGTGVTLEPRTHFVQNFGRTRTEPPPIVGGAYERAGGGRIRLIAHHYDADSRSPSRFDAMVDGGAVPLAPVAGEPGNQTFQGTADLPAGCATLRFVLEDRAGDTTTYPTTGALLVGASCTADFRSGPPSGGGDDGGPVVIDANDEEGGCRATRPFDLALAWLALGFLALHRRR